MTRDKIVSIVCGTTFAGKNSRNLIAHIYKQVYAMKAKQNVSM